MKNQGIPDHKMNFTGKVSQALDETSKTKQNASNKGAVQKQSNQKDV
ncbi:MULTISPECIES: hypothetical protein [Metabacillus]|uniref:Small, acid-soluble spore protein gamma-type n=2 Tax=Metabacillus TaxID=2675233 RepID=A0ABX6S6U0_9BACI|nr:MULTISPECIES: hypothetical protein [Metabacillus]QNF29835.1 hypothetical protein HUW50_21485 [Metabacillus sp. KUDC1714]